MVKGLKGETKNFSKIFKNTYEGNHISKVAALDPTNLLKDELRKWYISRILSRL